jgi:hypothetical protein
MDADARRLRIPLDGVTEHDAAAMVATGDWRYVNDAEGFPRARAPIFVPRTIA